MVFEPGDKVRLRGNHPVHPLAFGVIISGDWDEMYRVRLQGGQVVSCGVEELMPV